MKNNIKMMKENLITFCMREKYEYYKSACKTQPNSLDI